MYYQSNQNKSPASHFLVGEGNNEQLTVPESSLCAFDRTSGSLTHASEQHRPMWKCNNKWNSKNCLREGHRNSCPSMETQLFWSPVFLARSFTHLLTLLISSSWCRTWHAGTWSWYIMHDCYPRGYVTDEQTNMTVFNTIKDTSKTISQMQRQKTNGTAFTRQHSTLSILSRHSWREHLCEVLCDWKKQDRQTRMQTE